MSVRTSTTHATSASSVEAALLTRLGLPANASTQEIETAHEELIGFLESAPTELRAWAGREIDGIDEAYALLSDPTIDRSGLTADASVVPASLNVAATSPEAAASKRRRSAGSTAASPQPDQPSGPPASRSMVRRLAIIAAALVGVVAIAVVGYNMGAPAVPGVAGAADAAAAQASPAVDTARVAELMQKIQADPEDVTSLQALADIYFLANEFETAGGFLEKILSIDSQDLTARLALGAVLFNIGQPDDAEDHWRQVLAIDPDNLEAHYDLGFLYLSREPADLAQAKVEWARVVEIAPDSDIARSVQQHLASLDTSAAPSISPAPSNGASPAPAASPAPSGE